jgi:hypothetical protein
MNIKQLLPMTPEQEDLCIQFVLDKQKGFLPLRMAIDAIRLTMRCSNIEAVAIYKMINR